MQLAEDQLRRHARRVLAVETVAAHRSRVLEHLLGVRWVAESGGPLVLRAAAGVAGGWGFASGGGVPAQDFEDDERDDGEEVAVLRTRALQHLADGFVDALVLGDHGLDCGHGGVGFEAGGGGGSAGGRVVEEELLHQAEGLDEAEAGEVARAGVFVAWRVADGGGGDSTVGRRAGAG